MLIAMCTTALKNSKVKVTAYIVPLYTSIIAPPTRQSIVITMHRGQKEGPQYRCTLLL